MSPFRQACRLSSRAKRDGFRRLTRVVFAVVVLLASVLFAQNSTPAAPQKSQAPGSTAATGQRTPNLEPPRSDRVNVNDLGDSSNGQSSSKDTAIDLTPPPDDAKAHPKSSEILKDAEGNPDGGDVDEMHPWDPHRAAKDIEVGDFYFKRKNYRAAEDRYREALYYKDNDALATFRLAVCLEKLSQPDDARTQYENYLKILPHGPQAEDAQKAIERLKAPEPSTKAAK